MNSNNKPKPEIQAGIYPPEVIRVYTLIFN